MKRMLMTMALLAMTTVASAQTRRDPVDFEHMGLLLTDEQTFHRPPPVPVRPVTEADVAYVDWLWRVYHPPTPPPPPVVVVPYAVPYAVPTRPAYEPYFMPPPAPYIPWTPSVVPPFVPYHFTPIPAPQLHTPPLQKFYTSCTTIPIGRNVYTSCF